MADTKQSIRSKPSWGSRGVTNCCGVPKSRQGEFTSDASNTIGGGGTLSTGQSQGQAVPIIGLFGYNLCSSPSGDRLFSALASGGLVSEGNTFSGCDSSSSSHSSSSSSAAGSGCGLFSTPVAQCGLFGSTNRGSSSSGGGPFGGDLFTFSRSSAVVQGQGNAVPIVSLFGCNHCSSPCDGGLFRAPASSGGMFSEGSTFSGCDFSASKTSMAGCGRRLFSATGDEGGLFGSIISGSSGRGGGLFGSHSGGCGGGLSLFSTGSKLFDTRLGSQGGLFSAYYSSSSSGAATSGGWLCSTGSSSTSTSSSSGDGYLSSGMLIPCPSSSPESEAKSIGMPGRCGTSHIQIFLRTPRNRIMAHSLDPKDSANDLMMAIQDKLMIPTHMQRLLIEGRQVRNIHKALAEYNIQRGSVVRVVERFPLRRPSGYVCIKMLKDGNTFLVKSGECKKVSDLIASIKSEACVSGLELTLVFQGQRMLDNSTLLDYNIKMGCLIHCLTNKPLSIADSSKAKASEQAKNIVKVENALRKLTSSQIKDATVDFLKSISQRVETASGADTSLEARWKAKMTFFEAEKARRCAEGEALAKKARKRVESATVRKTLDEDVVCKELEVALHGKDIGLLRAAVTTAQQLPFETAHKRQLMAAAEALLSQKEKEAADEAERKEQERRKRMQEAVAQRRAEAEACEKAEKDEQRRLDKERKQKRLDRQREKDELEKQRKEDEIRRKTELKQRQEEEQQKKKGTKSRNAQQQCKKIEVGKTKNKQDVVSVEKEAVMPQARLSTDDVIIQAALAEVQTLSSTFAEESQPACQASAGLIIPTPSVGLEVPQPLACDAGADCLEDGGQKQAIKEDVATHKAEEDSITDLKQTTDPMHATSAQESSMQSVTRATCDVVELEEPEVMDVIDRYQVRVDGYLTVHRGDKVFVHCWKGPDKYESNGWAYGSLVGVAHKIGWLPQRVLALPDSDVMEVITPYEVGSPGYLTLQLGQYVVVRHRREGDQYEARGWAYGEVKERSSQQGWFPLRILSRRSLLQ